MPGRRRLRESRSSCGCEAVPGAATRRMGESVGTAGGSGPKTEPGSFTEFRIVLPRRAASLGTTGTAA